MTTTTDNRSIKWLAIWAPYVRCRSVPIQRRAIRRINKLVAVCLFLYGSALSSCSDVFFQNIRGDFSDTDTARIRQMITDYRLGWLAGDRAKVLDLFADDATLFPSGLRPIRGKGEMSKFWWPKDGSKT